VSYTITVTTDLAPADAEAKVRETLAAEGFGILAEIDVQAKLQEKLGEDIGTYRAAGGRSAVTPPG
jgi:uncharacterized protein (DUF302 family)